MGRIALVSALNSLSGDHDMTPLLKACAGERLDAEIRFWDDPLVDWSAYDAVILRSPWDYHERLGAFLEWCETISKNGVLHNPLSAVRWSLDKHYLADLASLGVPVVPTWYLYDSDTQDTLGIFLEANPEVFDFVIKPAIGCYSKGVKRFNRMQVEEAGNHIASLLARDGPVILQPYLKTVDHDGETNLIYFDGRFSHAIRKGALLNQNGIVNVPTNDFRSRCDSSPDERAVAEAALEATAAALWLDRPLLYARIDLIRDDQGQPRLLELEIAEPSLSLQFADGGAERFAKAMANATRAVEKA